MSHHSIKKSFMLKIYNSKWFYIDRVGHTNDQRNSYWNVQLITENNL